MKRTIDDLRNVWLQAGYTLAPYSKEDIQKAVDKFGRLPEVLIEYYEKIGEIEDEEDHSLQIFAPEYLSVRTPGFLDFSREIADMAALAISLNDLEQNNPVVYCCGENVQANDLEGYIPGTHPKMLDDGFDFRTLMNYLWQIAYYEIEPESRWEFEDDDN